MGRVVSYKLQKWRKLRQAQLDREPYCRQCLREGKRTAARIADHIVPHRDDPALFYDPANLQSLCAHHHNADKQMLEKSGRVKKTWGADGWPVEPAR